MLLARCLLAVALLFHIGMLLSLQSHSCLQLFHDAWQRPGPGADFHSIRQSGLQLRLGEDPYAYLPQRRAPGMPMYAPFRYLPGVASTLGVAMSWLAPQTAYRLWLVLLELTLMLDLLLVWRLLRASLLRWIACAAWLTYTPLVLEFWMGQFTLVASSLLFWSVLAWEARRHRTAAVLWAGASLLKFIGVALVPWLVRRRQGMALGLGGLLLGWSAVWFVQHPESWRVFSQANLGFQEIDLHEFHAGNLGLQSLLFHITLLSGVPSAEAWRLVAAGLPAVLGVAAAWRMIGDPSPRSGAILALLLLPLAFKHVWEHHYVALLPAMTLLLDDWKGSRKRCLVLGICWVVLALPTLFGLQPGTPGTNPELDWSVELRLSHHAVKPLAALALFVCVVGGRVPSRTSDAPRESTARARSTSSG